MDIFSFKEKLYFLRFQVSQANPSSVNISKKTTPKTTETLNKENLPKTP